MRQKYRLVSIVVLVFFIFMTGCQEKIPSNPKVALVLPLTGILAPWGKSCEQAIRLRLDEEKIHLQLVVFDNQANPKKTKQIFTLIAQDPNIIAVIGPLKCTCLQSVLPIINEERLPTISPGCFQDFRNETKGWVMPLLNEMQEVETIAEFLNKRTLSWVLFYEDNKWGQSLSQLLQDMVKNPPLITQVLHQADISFLQPRLQGIKPEAIVVFASPEKAGLLAFQIKKIGLDPYFLGSYCLLDHQFYIMSNPINNKVLVAVPSFPSKQSVFEKSFIKRYHANPSWIAVCAYATMDAILKVQKFSRTRIRKDFENGLSLRFILLSIRKRQPKIRNEF